MTRGLNFTRSSFVAKMSPVFPIMHRNWNYGRGTASEGGGGAENRAACREDEKTDILKAWRVLLGDVSILCKLYNTYISYT